MKLKARIEKVLAVLMHYGVDKFGFGAGLEMKKGILISILSFIVFLLFLPNASALSIQTSGAGNLYNDTYSFLFVIDDLGSEFDGTFSASLTNTSYSSSSGALINNLAFNLIDEDPVLGNDFFISNVSPVWNFYQNIGGGILFDYVGGFTSSSNSLNAGDVLTFDLTFTNSAYYAQGFDIFTGSELFSAIGLGGVNDIGQVAAHFQHLGSDGAGNDVVVATTGNIAPVPEPATMLLLGTGLLGLVGSIKKK